MAIPRRLIVLAVSAAAAGAVFYVSSRMKKAPNENDRRSDKSDGKDADKKSPIDEANAEKDAAAQQAEEKKQAESSTASTEASSASSASASTSQKELALFLAGDAWHDEIGWQALWEKEAIAAPAEWLKTAGKEVLLGERKKLVEHPALLAGCRRRWIVVCRYAGIDVGDAATLWTSTEVAV